MSTNPRQDPTGARYETARSQSPRRIHVRTRSSHAPSAPPHPTSYRSPYAETFSSVTEMHAPAVTNVPMATHLHRGTPQSDAYPVNHYSSREHPHAPPATSHRSSSSVGTNSYMDYDSNSLHSPSASSSITQQCLPRPQTYASQPHHSNGNQREPAAPEDYNRDARGPFRLRATPVRPPRSFKYELQPAHGTNSREAHYDSSASPSNLMPPPSSRHSQYPPQPPLQPLGGSYREISPFELSVAQSRTVRWGDGYTPSASSSDNLFVPRETTIYTKPFIYEPGRTYLSPEEHHTLSLACSRMANSQLSGSRGGYGAHDNADELSIYGTPLQQDRDGRSADRTDHDNGRSVGDIRDEDVATVEVLMPGGARVRIMQGGRREQERR